MPRAGNIDYIEVVLFYDPVEMYVDKVQTGRSAPMSQKPGFYMFKRQWYFKEMNGL